MEICSCNISQDVVPFRMKLTCFPVEASTVQARCLVLYRRREMGFYFYYCCCGGRFAHSYIRYTFRGWHGLPWYLAIPVMHGKFWMGTGYRGTFCAGTGWVTFEKRLQPVTVTETLKTEPVGFSVLFPFVIEYSVQQIIYENSMPILEKSFILSSFRLIIGCPFCG